MTASAGAATWAWQLSGSHALARLTAARGHIDPPEGQVHWQGQVLLAPESENWLLALDAAGLHSWHCGERQAGLSHWQQQPVQAFPLPRAVLADVLLPALGMRGLADDPVADHEGLVQRVCRAGARLFHCRARGSVREYPDAVQEALLQLEVHGALLAHAVLWHPQRTVLTAHLDALGLDPRDDTPLGLALRRLAGWAPPAREDRVQVVDGH